MFGDGTSCRILILRIENSSLIVEAIYPYWPKKYIHKIKCSNYIINCDFSFSVCFHFPLRIGGIVDIAEYSQPPFVTFGLHLIFSAGHIMTFVRMRTNNGAMNQLRDQAECIERTGSDELNPFLTDFCHSTVERSLLPFSQSINMSYLSVNVFWAANIMNAITIIIIIISADPLRRAKETASKWKALTDCLRNNVGCVCSALWPNYTAYIATRSSKKR